MGHYYVLGKYSSRVIFFKGQHRICLLFPSFIYSGLFPSSVFNSLSLTLYRQHFTG